MGSRRVDMRRCGEEVSHDRLRGKRLLMPWKEESETGLMVGKVC